MRAKVRKSCRSRKMLQKSALTQPRASLSKFGDAYIHHQPPVINSALYSLAARRDVSNCAGDAYLATAEGFYRGVESHLQIPRVVGLKHLLERLLEDMHRERVAQDLDSSLENQLCTQAFQLVPACAQRFGHFNYAKHI